MSIFSKKYPFLDCGFTTDVHSHILPAVDDGSGSMETSLAILRHLQEVGVKQVVFTPHINPEFFSLGEAKLREAFADFKNQLPPDIHISLYLAGEYMVHSDFMAHISDDMLCYPDKSILIEMSYFYRSENIREAIFELNMAGYKPIIAHPERYIFYQEQVDSIRELSEMDCRFQLNILSLSGYYGKGSLKMINHLMKQHLYSFLATDVHSEKQLSMMFDTMVKEKDLEILKLLAKNNVTLLA